MKKKIFKRFLFFRMLFFVSNVINTQPLSLVIKMPDYIVKNYGLEEELKCIYSLYSNRSYKVKGALIPYITLGVIGELDRKGETITDIAGNKYSVFTVKQAVQKAIITYKKFQNVCGCGLPVQFRLNRGVELLYKGKPNVICGDKNVDIVQRVNQKKSSQFNILVELIRSNLNSLGIKCKYNFVPRFTVANISSSQAGIVTIKKNELKPNGSLKKLFESVDSITEKLYLKNVKNKLNNHQQFIRVDEIFLSYDKQMSIMDSYSLVD